MRFDKLPIEKLNIPEKPKVDEQAVISEQPTISTQEKIVLPKELDNLDKNTALIQKILTQIDEEKLPPKEKVTFKKIKEKLVYTVKKFYRVARFAAVMTTAAAVTNYEVTHPTLDVDTNPDGTHTYVHPDERTTHLLNVIAGIEKYTEEDVLIDLRARFKEFLEKKGVSVGEDWENISADELEKVAIAYSKDSATKEGDMAKYIAQQLELVNGPDSIVRTPSLNLYERVWQMEQECGNPKIRFYAESEGVGTLLNHKKVIHYDGISNTIYLYPKDFKLAPADSVGSGVIAEMSHAKQVMDNPVDFYMQSIADIVKVLKRTGVKNITSLDALTAERDKLYNEAGTVEHEAHKIIEPYLDKKYNPPKKPTAQ